jgi:hypothetical protein
MKSSSLYVAFLLLWCSTSLAQPDHYNFNTPGQSNSMPWNLPAGKQVQILYQPGAFAQPVPATAGYVSSLSFMINQNLGPWTYSDLTIKLGQTVSTALPTSGFYTGIMDTVYHRSSSSLTGTSGQWMNITLDNTFYYDPSLSLVLEISHCGAPGATGFSACFTPVGNVTRCWSTGGCPFVYSTWSNQVYHMGIGMGSVGIQDELNSKAAFTLNERDGELLAGISKQGENLFSIYLSDILGLVVYRKEEFAVRNRSEVVIDSREFKSGVYIATLISKDTKITRKVIIGR